MHVCLRIHRCIQPIVATEKTTTYGRKLAERTQLLKIDALKGRAMSFGDSADDA